MSPYHGILSRTGTVELIEGIYLNLDLMRWLGFVLVRVRKSFTYLSALITQLQVSEYSIWHWPFQCIYFTIISPFQDLGQSGGPWKEQVTTWCRHSRNMIQVVILKITVPYYKFTYSYPDLKMKANQKQTALELTTNKTGTQVMVRVVNKYCK